MADNSTRLSSQDAATSKMSAIRLGYLQDDFLSIFHIGSIKKMPVINRGTYARVKCLSILIDQFLSTIHGDRRQIIILGCGIDSLALNLMKHYSNLRIFEIDFEETMEYKKKCLLKESEFLKSVWPTYSLNDLHYGPLTMIGGDLRNPLQTMSSLADQGCDFNVPTLIISECVLVYLQREHCLELLQILSQHFNNAAMISYDMLNPNDRFGQIMQQNIAFAGYCVPGFFEFPTLESQQTKFLSTNWSSARAITMLRAYETLIPKDELKRVSRLEIFDEVEEWQMLMSHYSLSLAVKGAALEPFYQGFGEMIGG